MMDTDDEEGYEYLDDENVELLDVEEDNVY